MNEKRFTIKESVFAEEKEVMLDNENQYTFPPLCIGDNYMFRKALNELSDENEQLKNYIKNNFIGSVCDTCEYCKLTGGNDWLNGIYMDLECEKGHKDMDRDDCEDYKLTSEVFE